MAEKKTITVPLGRGSSVKLFLSKKAGKFPGVTQGHEKGTGKSSGLFPVDRPSDMIVPPSGSGINFYDTLVLNDVGIYHSMLPVLVLDNDSLSDEYEPVTEDQHNTLVTEIETDIFTITLDNWKTTFKKITKASNLSKEVGIDYDTTDGHHSESLKDSSKFSSTGLKLTNTELNTLALGTGGYAFTAAGYDFNSGATNTGIKVTAIKDIDSDAVEFTPALIMDVFFFPALVVNRGITHWWKGFHLIPGPPIVSDVIYHKQLLNIICSPFVRTLLEQHWTINDSADSAYSKLYQEWNLMKSWPDARMKQGLLDFQDTPPYTYHADWSDESPGSFPDPDVYPESGVVNIGSPAPIENQQQDLEHGLGYFTVEFDNRLAMMIKKGTQWFYFWRV